MPPGYYPVVSMTDGIVESKGWLELGGCRLGIRAPHGAYFYYAHLDSYADIEEGDTINAGDLLGFMGDTGYGTEEGTRGNFRSISMSESISIKTSRRSASIRTPRCPMCRIRRSAGTFKRWGFHL